MPPRETPPDDKPVLIHIGSFAQMANNSVHVINGTLETRNSNFNIA
jgi:hypothetical protein